MQKDPHRSEPVWKAGPEIVQLVIGLNPAEYENGYNAATDRLDYFRNPSVRQAVALCIDRQGIGKEIFSDKAGLATLSDLLGSRSGSVVDCCSVVLIQIWETNCLNRLVGWIWILILKQRELLSMSVVYQAEPH